jgi:hypothetical protein
LSLLFDLSFVSLLLRKGAEFIADITGLLFVAHNSWLHYLQFTLKYTSAIPASVPKSIQISTSSRGKANSWLSLYSLLLNKYRMAKG